MSFDESLPSLVQYDGEQEEELILTNSHFAGPAPIRRIVPAEGQPLPETYAFPSVFEWACAPANADHFIGAVHRRGHQSVDRDINGASSIRDAVHLDIKRSYGLVRCTRVHYLDTEAWQEREAERRARQRPPKPTAKVKTRSKKLAELVGA